MDLGLLDLVAFGRRYLLPGEDGGPPRLYELLALHGPTLSLTWGAVDVVDPTGSERGPDGPHLLLGGTTHPTLLSALRRLDGDGTEPPIVCAAVLGRADLVQMWQPLVVDERRLRLPTGSGLGAFVDATAAADLRTHLEDPLRVAGLLRDVPVGVLGAVESGNRVAAVPFAVPERERGHPVYVGYDEWHGGVAVVVDLGAPAVVERLDDGPPPGSPQGGGADADRGVPPGRSEVATPDLLLAADVAVAWPEARGTLRRVDGPTLDLGADGGLAWFDLLDPRTRVRTDLDGRTAATRSTAVEWPEAPPTERSGAALCVGDPDLVTSWTETDELGVDRGIGVVAPTGRNAEVVRMLEDDEIVLPLARAVYAEVLRPLEIGGEVVGVAFHCGMGATTGRLLLGRDDDGRTVAVLADLELLDGARMVEA